MRRRFMTPIVSGGVMANVGDIAYKATDGSIKVVAPDAWNSAFGAVIGVVVIPSGFAPDNGLARIVSLKWASTSSTSATSAISIKWSNTNSETRLPIYNRIPRISGSNTNGHFASDKFVGYTMSDTDPYAGYYRGAMGGFIPSPYLGDAPNPAYYAPISGYTNALSDFDGKGNTDVLAALGSDYAAATAARKYKSAGAEEIVWYLPAAGELGYLMARLNKIKTSLTLVSAAQLDGNYSFWLSTKYSANNAYYFSISDGYIEYLSMNTSQYVRPFAQLDF